jgi:hypothetical protein
MERVMTVAPIKGRHQSVEEGPVAQGGEEKKEYIKRWRGLEFFLRFESHQITKIHRGPALPQRPAPLQGSAQQASGPHLVEDLAVAHGIDSADSVSDTTKTTTKIKMVSCGVTPPNDTSGPSTQV